MLTFAKQNLNLVLQLTYVPYLWLAIYGIWIKQGKVSIAFALRIHLKIQFFFSIFLLVHPYNKQVSNKCLTQRIFIPIKV